MLQGWSESLLYNWCMLVSTYSYLTILVVFPLVTKPVREEHKINNV